MTQSAKHYEKEPDKAQATQEVTELSQQAVVEESPAPPTSEAVEQFHITVRCMNHVLDGIRYRNDNTLEELLAQEDDLGHDERKALSDFYMAAAARDIETNQFISGIERNRLLNQALRHLQPVLAVALRPGLRQERQAYNELAVRVNAVRNAIKSAILSELPAKAKAKPEKAEPEKAEPEKPITSAEELKKKAPAEEAPVKISELAAEELEAAEDGKKPSS